MMETLLDDVRRCRACAAELPFGPRPVVQASAKARILVIGQAPGSKVHASGVPWDDQSGDRLRAWMGLAAPVFYDPTQIAIMPMAFCYPGASRRGGDSPPPRRCAPMWHPLLCAQLTSVELVLLIGVHAQKYYLGGDWGTLTQTVASYRRLLPRILPLPHPSWRVVGWMRRNPWFEDEVLPQLRKRVREALA